MSLELHLRLAGAAQIGIAFLHFAFPRRFQWRQELARLSLVNRQIFVVHTIFVCVVLLLVGSLSLFAADTLLERHRLAQLVLGGLTAFWALRLAFQWFVYDSSLWRGNRVNTAIHVAASAIWAYFTAVYATAALLGR